MIQALKKVKVERIFLISLIILSIYFSWLNRNFFFDDALIYARYIQNLLDGYGLVYNVGEKFNGLTSPLFTYLSVVMSFLLNDVITAINFLSGLFLTLSVVTIYKIFQIFGKINSYYLFVGLLLIISNQFTYSVFGMETFLFIFLINFSIYLFLKHNYGMLFLVLALLMLTRNEGIFLVVALAFEHFRLKRDFPNIRVFIIPLVLVLMHFVFNFSYYGALFPETGSAKIWQGMSGLAGEQKPIFLYGAKYLIDWFFSGSTKLIVILISLSILGIYYLGRNSLNIIVIIFLILLLSFYSFLNIPNYHWYNAPFIIFLFIYSAIGLKCLYIILNKYIKSNIILSVLLSLLVIYLLYNNFKYLHFGPSNHPYIKIGKWLEKNTPKNSSIAMVEIGIVGYFSERKIIDILGLVNPYNAKFIGERKFDKWLTKYTPDYIFLHDPIWPHEQGTVTVLQSGEYLEWEKFQFDGYKLFARKDLAIDRAEFKNFYELRNNYNTIIQSNKKIDSKHFFIQRYKRKEILFTHVGTSFNTNNIQLRAFLKDNSTTLNIKYGFLQSSYTNNNTEGGCFKIYKIINFEKKLLHQSCLDPANKIQDRKEYNYSLELGNSLEDKYLFEIKPRANKSTNWGWSYWSFGERNETK